MSSTWRQLPKYYFIQQKELYRIFNNSKKNRPQKIALDTLFPLIYYLDVKGSCSLFSLRNPLRYDDMGSAFLKEKPTSMCCYKDGFLATHDKGVTYYQSNAHNAAVAQNLDDFVQMGLPIQQRPKDLGEPVASFFSCDTQINEWQPVVYSVINKLDMKADYNNIIKNTIDSLNETCKINTPFELKDVAFYDHTQFANSDDKNNQLPVSGPLYSSVRQVSYQNKSLNNFQSICGSRWYQWDAEKQKSLHSNNVDGFPLLSIDSSNLLQSSFAVSTYGGNVHFIDTRSMNSAPIELHEPNSPIFQVKFSPIVQPLVVTSSNDYTIKLWDTRYNFEKPYLKLLGHTNEISSIQFSIHRGDFLFSSSYDGSIRVWNINNQCPPHHCLASIIPSTNYPVVEMVSGCHLVDSLHYSCADGATGFVEFKEEFFDPIIPHHLSGEIEKEAESLVYFHRNHVLYSKILPKINSILEKKEDVSPIYPLLELASLHHSDLSTAKLSNSPLSEVIDYYSYYYSNGIPSQFVQNPELQQLSDAKRALLFAKVIGGIQKFDAKTLSIEKRNILTALDAFSREQILGIVQVLATSSFEEALEIGDAYLDLVTRNKKNEKFLDVGYFLLYPTVYDDPMQKFIPYSEKGVDEKTRLKPIFDNTQKIKTELHDLNAILATGANDMDDAPATMFKTLSAYDSFVSLFLLRNFLSTSFTLSKWSKCIVRASAVAKELSSFPVRKYLFDWLENVVMESFSTHIGSILAAEKVDPMKYTSAIAEIIVIGTQAEELPAPFEIMITEYILKVKSVLDKFITQKESIRVIGLNPSAFAKKITDSMDNPRVLMSQKNSTRCRSAYEIAKIISNAIPNQ